MSRIIHPHADEQSRSMSGRHAAAKRNSPKRNNAVRLFGYDIFISFALGPPPRGTQSYASDLARRLRERDFTVFFSEEEAPPGEELEPTLRKALLRAKILAVIANRGTLNEPRWVRKEVELFRSRHPKRPVVAINVDRALQDSELSTIAQDWLGFQDKIWLDESQEGVENGIASDALVNRLAMTPAYKKAKVRWRWVVGVVVAGLAALAIALGFTAKIAIESGDRARAELRRAVSFRLTAEAQAMFSGIRFEGNERALLQLVGARRIAPGTEGGAEVLDALLRQRSLRKLVMTDGQILAIAVSPDGSRIVSGGDDHTLRLWDAKTGQPLGAPLKGHEGEVQSVAFSPDGKYIVSGGGGGDRTLRLWDAKTGQLIGAPLEGDKSSVYSVAFSPDSRRIVSGGLGNTVRLWPAPKAWPDELCAKLTRNMSRKEWRDWVSPEIEYECQCPGLPIPPDDPKSKVTAKLCPGEPAQSMFP